MENNVGKVRVMESFAATMVKTVAAASTMVRKVREQYYTNTCRYMVLAKASQPLPPSSHTSLVSPQI